MDFSNERNSADLFDERCPGHGLDDLAIMDLLNLCHACIMDGATDKEPLTMDGAACMLESWHTEGGELAADTVDVTPAALMTAWNETLRYC